MQGSRACGCGDIRLFTWLAITHNIRQLSTSFFDTTHQKHLFIGFSSTYHKQLSSSPFPTIHKHYHNAHSSASPPLTVAQQPPSAISSPRFPAPLHLPIKYPLTHRNHELRPHRLHRCSCRRSQELRRTQRADQEPRHLLGGRETPLFPWRRLPQPCRHGVKAQPLQPH